MSFAQQLKFGKIYEDKAINLFNYTTLYRPVGNFSAYDFKLDGKHRIEVKADRLAHKTGNMAIEFMSNGKASGIRVTRAKYWVYYVISPVKEVIYMIRVSVLKRLCVNQRVIPCGDGYRSRIYAIPLHLLEEYIINPEEKINLNI